MLHAEKWEGLVSCVGAFNKQVEKADKPTICSSGMARFGLSLSTYQQTKRIVPHSFVIGSALSVICCKRELLKLRWPLTCPLAIKSLYLTRHARDYRYHALSLFSVQHWKHGSGLGMRLLPPYLLLHIINLTYYTSVSSRLCRKLPVGYPTSSRFSGIYIM